MDPDGVYRWANWLSELITVHENDMILNCDEISWRLYPNSILTWWDTAGNDVSIHIHGDEKDCLTMFATISVSGIKYSLCFLAKGKTERVERTQIADHRRSHTESGWMTSDTGCSTHPLASQFPVEIRLKFFELKNVYSTYSPSPSMHAWCLCNHS
jgi:hypothetical protein